LSAYVSNLSVSLLLAGFPVERAALGSCDLSVLHVGGEWQWLVRHAGRDVAEGAARAAVDAQRQAEAVALKLLG
jgi:hypothetical protein